MRVSRKTHKKRGNTWSLKKGWRYAKGGRVVKAKGK
jgi:hypothetical protein